MWVTLAIIVLAMVMYGLEKTPLDLTSLAIICVLMAFFHFFPMVGPDGVNRLRPERLLEGFANPALLSVLGLLVMGQGIVRTGALDQVGRAVYNTTRGHPLAATGLALVVVVVVSAFLNNIPVVVIFIPIMQALADQLGRTASRLMIPLSYAAILGGMTTLIGSSTNLLVSSALIEIGEEPFGFFDFTIPGILMAIGGLVYILLVAPRLLPDRQAFTRVLVDDAGKQFIAQIVVAPDSRLAGEKAVGGFFPRLKGMTVRLVQRGEHAFLPPFEDFSLIPGDVVVIAATRKVLTEAIQDYGGESMADDVAPSPEKGGRRVTEQVLAEAMVAPSSRMIGQNLELIGFRYRYHCLVLGIQRHARMIRARMTEIRLEAGDVLLIQGHPDDVAALRANRDMVLLEWSAKDMPSPAHARRAGLIFAVTIGLAAFGILPIVISALGGAAAMVATGCLNMRQAIRAIDSSIVFMIGAALAMGTSLQATGGADYIAMLLIDGFGDSGPVVVLSAFFLTVAILSNIISTKACAVLFTPIAIGIAHGLGANPVAFAVAVVFASNCSFASPVGYQTNLLVMGPGHYRFYDFVRAGAPMIIFAWIIFTIVVPWYYGV
ncbi:MAG: SLC13 family permease [Alphaproteobacteria bacterium]|nr:SLC13 family permease [Alphaproteobacteria bacterium]